MNDLQSIIINLSAKTRHDRMEGRDFIVAPMVMITEGVHNGSNGPLYYPREELAKTPVVWNYKPIVVYHPQMNGKAVSACDPDVINSRKVGVIMNTKLDKRGRLVAEAWMEVNRIKEVDERVYKALESGEMMEVSTGLFTDNEEIEGEWKGEKYTAIARNYRPDHLAILPDQKGSCSIVDGAGLLRNQAGEEITLNGAEVSVLDQFRLEINEKSHQEIWKAIQDALVQKEGGAGDAPTMAMSAYVLDVYDTFVIFEKKGKIYRQEYSIDNEKAALVGTAEEVRRVTRYETTDGKVINQSKENDMDKKKIVDELISNTATPWEESDRDMLMKMDDAKLQKFVPVVANATAAPKDLSPAEQKAWDGMDEAARAAFVAKRSTKNAEAPKDAPKDTPKTVDEYIANAPEGMREVLQSGIDAHKAEKNKLIATITANKQNVFSADYLQTMPLAELKGIAVLAAGAEKPRNPAMFVGDPGTPATNQEEPLTAPVIDFSK